MDPTPPGSPTTARDVTPVPRIPTGADDPPPVLRCQPCAGVIPPPRASWPDVTDVLCCPVHTGQHLVAGFDPPADPELHRAQHDVEYPPIGPDSPVWPLLPQRPLYWVSAPTTLALTLVPTTAVPPAA